MNVPTNHVSEVFVKPFKISGLEWSEWGLLLKRTEADAPN